MGRARQIASAAFFFGYLSFQIVYPTLSWFSPGFDRFTWHMYAGQREDPTFAAIFADGSRREVGDPLRRGNPVRMLGPSVDQERFVPPYLCTHWQGAVRIVMSYPRTGREEIVTCPAPVR